MEAAEVASKPPRIIGEARDHDELLAALRRRKEQLELSVETLDHLAGLTARHSQKILGCNPGRGITRITLGPLLGSLGLKVLIVEDDEAIARIAPRWRKRNRNLVRNGPRKSRAKRAAMSASGGKADMARCGQKRRE